jgi:tellurite resistance protein TerC
MVQRSPFRTHRPPVEVRVRQFWLRPLYFLTVGLLDRLAHLAYGLAVVLAVIGVKLILHFAHFLHLLIPEVSTPVSMVLVVAALGVSVFTSLRASRNSLKSAAR